MVIVSPLGQRSLSDELQMEVANYLLSGMILQLPDAVRFNPVQLKARFVSFCFISETVGDQAEVD